MDAMLMDKTQISMASVCQNYRLCKSGPFVQLIS